MLSFPTYLWSQNFESLEGWLLLCQVPKDMSKLSSFHILHLISYSLYSISGTAVLRHLESPVTC